VTHPSSDEVRDASWRVLDALKTAPEPLRHSAREAIGAGNQETFITLVSDFLRMPTSGHSGPRIADEVLERVDWDWLAGEFFVGPEPSDSEPPPPGRFP
jgi:hypothetical protein